MNDIKGIKFTKREIEVLACIIHNRGDKKIANLLDISPRTVGSHVRNIMLKSGSNSKDAIRDFIESSKTLSNIKKIYNQLLIIGSFRKHLEIVNRQIKKTNIQVRILFPNDYNKTFCEKIISDLKIAGIIVNKNQNNTYRLKDFDPNNYYHSIFNLICEITARRDILGVYQEFKQEYINLKSTYSQEGEAATKTNSQKQKINISPKYLITVFLILAFLFYHWNQNNQISVRSDLIVPREDILIQRRDLQNKINDIFAHDKNNIPIAVLTGIGGSGKTILARLYARSQENRIIWEIDSSSSTNMYKSYNKLALNLKNTLEDKDAIADIERTNDIDQKMKKLEVFISRKLSKYNDWLFIYNNTSSFENISQYFPHDYKKWGYGRIIITTRNSNIDQSDYIKSENIVEIGELSNEERNNLFEKKLGLNYTEYDKKYKDTLVKTIPPFPLDIAQAANLIKNTKLPFQEYIKKWQNEQKYLANWQESFSTNNSNYCDTRYKISQSAIKQILNKDKDFFELMLLVNTINSQNIPRDLLLQAADRRKVCDFISEMREFSAIREKDSKDNSFSMHQSNQKFYKKYLIELAKKNKQKNLLEPISKHLIAFMNSNLKTNNLHHTRNMIPHINEFIENYKEFTGKTHTELLFKLGEAYFDIGDYNNSKKYLEDSLRIYNQIYGPNSLEAALVKSRLGILYRNLGFYEESLKLLSQSYKTHKIYYSDERQNPAMGKILIYLGSAYRNLKEYKKAEEYTLKGIDIYQNHYSMDSIEMAWAKAYYACILGHIGKEDKALKLFEESMILYNRNYENSPIKRAWLSVRAGQILTSIGKHKEAEKLLNDARKIYSLNVSEDSIELAWNISHLGILYSNMGRKAEAKKCFRQSLEIYSKRTDWPEDHQTIMWVKERLLEV